MIITINIMNGLYATTKSGSMTQERLLKLISQVIIKHTDGIPRIKHIKQ